MTVTRWPTSCSPTLFQIDPRNCVEGSGSAASIVWAGSNPVPRVVRGGRAALAAEPRELKTICQLRTEIEAWGQCLAEFQRPIPHPVMERATRAVTALLAECPPEHRFELTTAAHHALGITTAEGVLPKTSRAPCDLEREPLRTSDARQL